MTAAMLTDMFPMSIAKAYIVSNMYWTWGQAHTLRYGHW